MKRLTLILGGARSGKSRYAESLSALHQGSPTYIATAEITDAEMEERIARHRQERGHSWRTIEAPLDLSGAVRQADAPGAFTLVECLTVWINNLMYHGMDVAAEVDRLCTSLGDIKGRVVVVSNEVGLGIVPDNALARRFRDEAGRANRAIAAVADEVVFIAAGLPMTLKQPRQGARRARPAGKARGHRG